MSTHALLIAAKNGYHREVSQLLKGGHSVRSRDRDNATALYWVACYGHNAICEELIRYGAEVDAKVTWGSTPLHAACDRGRTECVKTLLKHGSNVNGQNLRQDTPLHLASFRGHSDIVSILIQYGADLDISNGKHKTAEMEAQGQGHLRITNIMEEERQRRNVRKKSIRFKEDNQLNDIRPSLHRLSSGNWLHKLSNSPGLLSPEEPNSPLSWDGTVYNRANLYKSDVKPCKSLNQVFETQNEKLNHYGESENNATSLREKGDSEINNSGGFETTRKNDTPRSGNVENDRDIAVRYLLSLCSGNTDNSNSAQSDKSSTCNNVKINETILNRCNSNETAEKLTVDKYDGNTTQNCDFNTRSKSAQDYNENSSEIDKHTQFVMSPENEDNVRRYIDALVLQSPSIKRNNSTSDNSSKDALIETLQRELSESKSQIVSMHSEVNSAKSELFTTKKQLQDLDEKHRDVCEQLRCEKVKSDFLLVRYTECINQKGNFSQGKPPNNG